METCVKLEHLVRIFIVFHKSHSLLSLSLLCFGSSVCVCVCSALPRKAYFSLPNVVLITQQSREFSQDSLSTSPSLYLSLSPPLSLPLMTHWNNTYSHSTQWLFVQLSFLPIATLFCPFCLVNSFFSSVSEFDCQNSPSLPLVVKLSWLLFRAIFHA